MREYQYVIPKVTFVRSWKRTCTAKLIVIASAELGRYGYLLVGHTKFFSSLA